MRRALAFLLFCLAFGAQPSLQAAGERTLKARILEIDGARDRVRADVRGRPTSYALANGNLLRGFRKGDLVLLRVRGGTVIDVRLAVLAAEVLRSDDRGALLRVGGRDERFALARPGLRGQLKRGDFVRVEVEERNDGTRVVTRVF